MGQVRHSIIWSAVAILLIGGSILIHYRRLAAANVEAGREAGTMVLLSQLEQAIALYRADYDLYPKSLEALMWTRPKSPGGRHCYIVIRENAELRRLLVDAWGRPFIFRLLPPPRVSGQAVYQLYSMGPDGIDEQGKGDDVRLE